MMYEQHCGQPEDHETHNAVNASGRELFLCGGSSLRLAKLIADSEKRFCGRPLNHKPHFLKQDVYCEGVEREANNEVLHKEVYVPNTSVENDSVKIPAHYTSGTIEVANFIADQGLDYHRGNVVKYVCRAGKKDPAKELEDLEKAAAYLQMVYNKAKGLDAVIRDPETKEVVWSIFQNK